MLQKVEVKSIRQAAAAARPQEMMHLKPQVIKFEKSLIILRYIEKLTYFGKMFCIKSKWFPLIAKSLEYKTQCSKIRKKVQFG